MQDLDELSKKIDAKIAELEGNKKDNLNDVDKRESIDQSQDAIDSIRNCVTKILKIKDFEDKDLEEYNDKLFTLFSWFNYLKKEKYNTNEYKEAKELILSIGLKHSKLNSFCNKIVQD